ncbi:MAG: aminodeoxychorismate/anthranilate synthase component II [Oscillospiraceae bacterium]|nr:aminodeoxychorismate/anthranilate synthase component II [Oscillospiraceae bacterium]
MLLLIDNYDSFSYNLYQAVGAINPQIEVRRNDKITVAQILELNPSHIILSPGPGKPENAGICIDVIKQLGDKIPILGVCLGHQAICEAYGGVVSYARELMHGKQSEIEIVPECPIFKGLPKTIKAARYHSLAAVPETLPDVLEITARTIRTMDGEHEIMAVSHRDFKVYGVQFHPESILTPHGDKIIQNFIKEKRHD